MPLPDLKDLAEANRTAATALANANTLALTLERMHLDLKGFDLSGLVKELPGLIAAMKP